MNYNNGVELYNYGVELYNYGNELYNYGVELYNYGADQVLPNMFTLFVITFRGFAVLDNNECFFSSVDDIYFILLNKGQVPHHIRSNKSSIEKMP